MGLMYFIVVDLKMGLTEYYETKPGTYNYNDSGCNSRVLFMPQKGFKSTTC